MYTIEDLERAREELRRWSDAFVNYSGNNPDKYSAKIRDAGRKVDVIEEELKRQGVIPMSEHERLSVELDASFPNAQSRDIVEHKGARYRLRFVPIEKSISGKSVKRWKRLWEQL
jgi:hypothetical protein